MKPHVRFIKSAAAPEQFPPAGPPEVAFLGRSNVGKSSLINSLLGAKHAFVSSTPGRTQTINFFGIHRKQESPPELLFADLPGYGYARVPKAIVSEWPKFIEPYLAERESLRLAVCLVDSNIPAQESDKRLITWLAEMERPLVVVATKTDRLSGNKLRASLQALTRELEVDRILPYSAKTGTGAKELWTLLRDATGTRP